MDRITYNTNTACTDTASHSSVICSHTWNPIKKKKKVGKSAHCEVCFEPLWQHTTFIDLSHIMTCKWTCSPPNRPSMVYLLQGETSRIDSFCAKRGDRTESHASCRQHLMCLCILNVHTIDHDSCPPSVQLHTQQRSFFFQVSVILHKKRQAEPKYSIKFHGSCCQEINQKEKGKEIEEQRRKKEGESSNGRQGRRRQQCTTEHQEKAYTTEQKLGKMHNTRKSNA